MQIGSPATSPDFFAIAGDHRASGQRKSAVLLTGTVGRPDNFRLAYEQPIAGQEWDAPRHHHDFEQIRFVLDGDITIAKGQKIPPGWVAYFPESAYYGPQSRGDMACRRHTMGRQPPFRPPPDACRPCGRCRA